MEDRIEKECDEIRKMVGMIVAKKEVLKAVSVHADLEEVHQCARTEVKQTELICFDQVARGRAARMQICAGAKNDQAHDKALSLW